MRLIAMIFFILKKRNIYKVAPSDRCSLEKRENDT